MALTESQRALADAMSEVSEYCWFAGWLVDTEYHLWRFVIDPSDQTIWGNYPVSLETREQLRRLSDAIGGWIHWSAGEDSEAFIASGDWQTKFDAWLREWKASEEAPTKLPRRYVDYPAWFAEQQGLDGKGDD